MSSWELFLLALTASRVMGSPGWEGDMSGQQGCPWLHWLGGLQDSSAEMESFCPGSGWLNCLDLGYILEHQQN